VDIARVELVARVSAEIARRHQADVDHHHH
jgi:hypothetical protein